MVKLYAMCGIPGSGKTTLSNELACQYKVIAYSCDDLRKHRPLKCGPFKPYIFGLVRQSLLDGQSVVVDDLYITEDSRYELLSAISDIPCKKILIVLQTPLEVCIDRDRTRTSHNLGQRAISHFYNKYQLPSMDEGWDEILYF